MSACKLTLRTKSDRWPVDGEVLVVSDFEGSFVRALKKIPLHDRTYDDATKVWTVRGIYLERLRALARKHFETAVLEERDDDGAETMVDLHTGAAETQDPLFR